MKFVRSVVLALVLLFAPSVARAQDKPSIMVMPSTMLMQEGGYCRSVNIDGRELPDCDIQKLLTTDKVFASVVANVSIAFQERGFPIMELEAAVKAAAEEQALRMTSNRAIVSTMQDQLLQDAKPDIAIELKVESSSAMGETKMNVILNAVDVYTSKSVATANMSSQPSSRSTPSELAKAVVVAMMPSIESKLVDHFRRLATSGREVRLRIEVLESAGLEDGVNSEIEVSGDPLPLRMYLSQLVRGVAVNGAVQPGRTGEGQMNFNSVSIPFATPADEVLLEIMQKFRKDTKMRARVGVGRGPGDLVMLIDGPVTNR